jgi:acyl-coenzyme A thioesterase PaaI-like protein
MAFATLAALEHGENCSLLEMKASYYRGMMQGDKLRIRGEVVRISRAVAFCRAIIAHENGDVAMEATGTNLLRRVKKD